MLRPESVLPSFVPKHVLFAAAVALPLGAGCVAYRPAPVDVRASRDGLDRPAPGRLEFGGAVVFAHAHNPKLAGLVAEAKAAGLDTPATTVGTRANFNQEHLSATADPIALLRLGPRGRAFAQADATRGRVLATLRREQWRIAGDIANAYAVLGVLSRQRRPDLGLSPRRFREAGLAAEADLRVLDQARAAAEAETIEIGTLRDATEARLRSLLGLGAGAAVKFAPSSEAFVAEGPADRDALLSRPDVAEAVARFRVADAALRRAVANQYPSLEIGGEINLGKSGSGSIVAVRLPVGATRRARAAEHRREAARHGVGVALLAAERDLAERLAGYGAAAAQLRHEQAARTAVRARHKLALARLAVTPDAFGNAAMVAYNLVIQQARHRRAAVEATRARVDLAVARGWPAPKGASDE